MWFAGAFFKPEIRGDDAPVTNPNGDEAEGGAEGETEGSFEGAEAEAEAEAEGDTKGEEVITQPDTLMQQDHRVGEPTTLMEKKLVAEMRSIVHGDMLAVPRFARDLVVYFDDGLHPRMPPADVAHHLAVRASFVLGSFFRLPEVVEDAKQGAQGAITHTPTATVPRWWDVGMGMCAMTPAWRLAAASAFAQLSGPRDTYIHWALCGALVGMRTYDGTMHNVGQFATDAALVFIAMYTHYQQYSFRACALAAVCCVARSTPTFL